MSQPLALPARHPLRLRLAEAVQDLDDALADIAFLARSRPESHSLSEAGVALLVESLEAHSIHR